MGGPGGNTKRVGLGFVGRNKQVKAEGVTQAKIGQVDSRIGNAELARGADQRLPRPARLDVEGDRLGGVSVS